VKREKEGRKRNVHKFTQAEAKPCFVKQNAVEGIAQTHTELNEQ
jgi:hypothetical protein